MTVRSTQTRYGTVAASLHWAIAILLFVAVGSGLAADAAGPDGTAPLRVHALAGISAALLTLFRIVWWWRVDTKPDAAPNTDGMRGIVAKTVHLLLIIVPLGMAASGVGMMVLSGAGPILTGDIPGPLPDFATLAPRTAHGFGALLLGALVLLHVGAALYHHFGLRDGLLRRMWFGKTGAP